MALDKAKAQELWNSRYRKELEDFARKNRYLDAEGMQDPENLFQDFALNVWIKAVNSFNAERVTFSTDVDRSFNAFFHNILNQYLANLAAHRDTGKSTYFREQQTSTDKPLKSGEDDEAGTLMDLLGGVDEDPTLQMDLERMLKELPQFTAIDAEGNTATANLAEPVKYILENAERGDIAEVFDGIRERWGLTKTRLFNALMDAPAFVNFIEAAD